MRLPPSARVTGLEPPPSRSQSPMISALSVAYRSRKCRDTTVATTDYRIPGTQLTLSITSCTKTCCDVFEGTIQETGQKVTIETNCQQVSCGGGFAVLAV